MSDQTPPGAVSDRERARAVLEQLKSVHAFDLGYEMMVGLVTFGYQKMGLTDETRPVRDLGDARLSIEMLRALLDVIEREQGEGRARDLHDTLAQMQLGYAHAVQLAGAEHAAAAPAEEPAESAAAGPEPAEAAPEPAAADTREGAAAPAEESGAARKPAAKKPPVKKPAAAKKAAKKKAAKKPPPKDAPDEA